MIYLISGFIIITAIEYFIGKNISSIQEYYDLESNKRYRRKTPLITKGGFILLLFTNIIPILREVVLLGLIGYIIIGIESLEIKPFIGNKIDNVIAFLNSEL